LAVRPTEIGDARIIKKPFVGNELANKVNAALARTDPRSGGKILPAAAIDRHARMQNLRRAARSVALAPAWAL
jgi:DNA-binding response OmpR family regulator